MPDSEHSIIEACLEGDRNAQHELYTNYSPKLMVVCLRYAKNKDDANEILQEGFYLVFKNLHQFKFLGSFEGWMRKIIINTAIQQHKENSKLSAVIPFRFEHERLPDQVDLNSFLDAKHMVELIQNLPTRYRLVFNLFVFEGYKHREIAQIMEISEGTSKSNLYDARMILQKNLTQNKIPKKIMIK